jgi:hypothetical protein
MVSVDIGRKWVEKFGLIQPSILPTLEELNILAR